MVEGYGATREGRKGAAVMQVCHERWLELKIWKTCNMDSAVERILETAKREFSLGIELGRGSCRG